MGPRNASLPAPPDLSECLPFFLWYWSIRLQVPQKLHVRLLCLAAEAQAQHSTGKLLAGVGENHRSLLAIQTLAIAVTS